MLSRRDVERDADAPPVGIQGSDGDRGGCLRSDAAEGESRRTHDGGREHDPARSAADHAPDRPLEARATLEAATKTHRLGLVEVDDVPA
jgi:hypothetical protein